MTKEAEALLKKAHSFLDAGHAAFARDDHERAVSHAYYAMFHSARAMLLARGVRSSSHKEVQGMFGLLFAKPSVPYRKFHRYLIDAARRRGVADYDAEPVAPISKNEAAESLTRAAQFITMAEQFLRGAGGDSE